MKYIVVLLTVIVLCMSSCNNHPSEITLDHIFDSCWNGSPEDVFELIGITEQDFSCTDMGSDSLGNTVIHYESKEPCVTVRNQPATLILEFSDEQMVLCSAQIFYSLEEDKKAYELIYNCTAQYDKLYEKDSTSPLVESFRGEQDYERFSEDSRLNPNMQQEWLCGNDSRLYVSYGKNASAVRVLIFYMAI